MDSITVYCMPGMLLWKNNKHIVLTHLPAYEDARPRTAVCEHSKLLRNYYDILHDDDDDDDENAVIQEEIIEVIEDESIKADGGNGRTGQTLVDIAMLEKLSSLYS